MYRIATASDKYSKDKKKALEYYEKYLTSGDTTKALIEYTQKRISQLKGKAKPQELRESMPDSLAYDAE
ncbi:MAG TPA: hypothetical protein VD908_19355 [Cytophagales bacterium]|nr:hypothetical protein [Cytophagales bacterium]